MNKKLSHMLVTSSLLVTMCVVPLTTAWGTGNQEEPATQKPDIAVDNHIPKGTIATANKSYYNSPPQNAIDGRTGTPWNPGTNSGTIDFTFPYAVSIKGIKIAADALPANYEVYTIYGLQKDKWIQIAKATRYVPNQSTILDTIPVTAGLYDGIIISTDSPYSWVGINEVILVQ